MSVAVHPGYVGGTWSIVRVNDDGRLQVVHSGLREDAAAMIAGAMRDEQRDEDVGDGWNVLPMSRGELRRRLRP